VEGPFSRNPVYTGVLATLLPREALMVSVDPLEGTARGAWMLAHWTEPAVTSPATQAALPLGGAAVEALHERWCAHAQGLVVAAAG
jgi:hypothetical protein